MSSLVRVLTSASHLWRSYLVIALCAVAVTAAGLLVPFIISAATDVIVETTQGSRDLDGAIRSLLWLAGGLLLAELARAVLQNVGGYAGDTMAARLRTTLSNRYYATLLSLPQRYYDTVLTGTVISRLNRSITELSQFLNSFSNNFLPMLLTVGAVLVISLTYSPVLTLLIAVVFPLYMWLTALTSKRWIVWEGEKNKHVDIAGGRFAEVIGQLPVVRSFAREDTELRNFAEHFARTIRLTRAQSHWWHLMDAIRRAVLALAFFGMYAYIFLAAARGEMTIGDVVLLVQLLAMVLQPVTMMSYLVDTTQRAIAGSRDYFAALSEDTAHERVLRAPADDTNPETERREVAALSTLAPTHPDVPAVQFDSVTFAYAEDAPVLHDVSFQVPRGHRVALVSESGGGKTTIINLLLGLHLPASGHIRILGHEVGEIGLERVRRGVGVVFQDASLFSGTIRENIAYGDPEASEEQIIAAAQDAGAHEFISRFPQGYDSLVGERGLKLSGGQKQRVSVARAILKDAPLLVLDEATSALDTKAERQVQAGLDKLMEGRTSIIIAHRLSTIAEVDTIITLRRGHVDEVGSPQELAGTDGIYAELLNLQASSSPRDRKRLKQFGLR